MFPERIKDNRAHTVAVRARSAGADVPADNGLLTHRFAPRAFTVLAEQPDVDSLATEAAVTGASGYRPPQAGYTLFSVAPYRLPRTANGVSTHGALGRYTDLSGGYEAAWNDGARLAQGIHLVRAFAGSYIDNQGGAPAECAGLAGTNVLFAWDLDAGAAPAIWAGPHADRSRELVIAFDLDVPLASGTAYAGASVLFRTLPGTARGDKYLFFDIQAFDTRTTQPLQAVYKAGNAEEGNTPIAATSFAHSAAVDFGRSVAGDFRHAAGGGWTHYEFRVNGRQLERALEALGCSAQDTTQLPCDASQLRFSIVALGVENVAPATLAATVGNFRVGYTADAE